MKELRQVGFRKCLPAGGRKYSVLLLFAHLRTVKIPILRNPPVIVCECNLGRHRKGEHMLSVLGRILG